MHYHQPIRRSPASTLESHLQRQHQHFRGTTAHITTPPVKHLVHRNAGLKPEYFEICVTSPIPRRCRWRFSSKVHSLLPCTHCLTYADIEQISPLPKYTTACLSICSGAYRIMPSSTPTHKAPNCFKQYAIKRQTFSAASPRRSSLPRLTHPITGEKHGPDWPRRRPRAALGVEEADGHLHHPSPTFAKQSRLVQPQFTKEQVLMRRCWTISSRRRCFGILSGMLGGVRSFEQGLFPVFLSSLLSSLPPCRFLSVVFP